MSKFVAIIDDEKWVGCPLEHEGYCHIAWNKYYKCMEDCDGVLNDRPEFCPLKEYKEAIPVEWLHSIMKKQLIFAMESEMEGTTTVQDGVIHCVSGALACQVLANVIELWEKENEQKN